MEWTSFCAGAGSGLLVCVVAIIVLFWVSSGKEHTIPNEVERKLFEFWKTSNDHMIIQRAVLMDIADAIREKKTCNPATA